MGSRYGVKIRKRENEVLKQQRSSYECPTCHKRKVKRKGYGVWECNSCKSRFAGGAYSFETSVGISAKKTLTSFRK